MEELSALFRLDAGSSPALVYTFGIVQRQNARLSDRVDVGSNPTLEGKNFDEIKKRQL